MKKWGKFKELKKIIPNSFHIKAMSLGIKAHSRYHIPHTGQNSKAITVKEM